MTLATLICHIFMTTKVYIAEQTNLNSQEVYSHSSPEISVTVKPWNSDLVKRRANENYKKGKNYVSETGLDVQQGYELQNSMIPGCKIVLIYVLWWWQCSKHDWNSAELQHFSKIYCERKYVQRYLVLLSSYTWLVHFLVIHRLAPLLIHGASLHFFPFIFVFLLCLESQINSWLFSTHHILKKTSKRYFKLTKYGWH